MNEFAKHEFTEPTIDELYIHGFSSMLPPEFNRGIPETAHYLSIGYKKTRVTNPGF